MISARGIAGAATAALAACALLAAALAGRALAARAGTGAHATARLESLSVASLSPDRARTRRCRAGSARRHRAGSARRHPHRALAHRGRASVRGCHARAQTRAAGGSRTSETLAPPALLAATSTGGRPRRAQDSPSGAKAGEEPLELIVEGDFETGEPEGASAPEGASEGGGAGGAPGSGGGSAGEGGNPGESAGSEEPAAGNPGAPEEPVPAEPTPEEPVAEEPVAEGGSSQPPAETEVPPAPQEPSPSGGAGGEGGAVEPFRFFAPTSFWNTETAAGAALDPSSAAIVTALVQEVAHEQEVKKGPAINTTSWSVPIYTVPADQPTVTVKLPYASSRPALQAAWAAVPLPPEAQPAAGSDKHLVVWQPSSDKLWEFWNLEKRAEGWEAYWGGAIQDALTDSGSYGPEAWSGAATNWGASASSLSIAGGLITLEDLEKGTINHALAIAVPDTRAKTYAAPAKRTDGASEAASSLPEGAHLRLNPALDLAALNLPHFTLMLAEAAQKYGIFVRDTAANVALYAQDPTPTGVNPYTGKGGYYEGKSPAQLLAAFPWSELQVLKMELHS
jgi:hypothetical protein